MGDQMRVEVGKGSEAEVSQAARTPVDLQSRTRARRSPPALVALVVIVVVAAVAGLLWTMYTRSPQRSLDQMAAAARSGDWAGVQTYIDVDAVGSHFVGTALATAKGDGPAAGGRSAMGRGSGRSAGSAPAMEQAFVQRFRDSLKARVEGVAKAGADGAPGLLTLKTKSVSYVSGTEALVTVEVPAAAGGTEDVRLRMKRTGDHWRIAALEGVVDLMGLLD